MMVASTRVARLPAPSEHLLRRQPMPARHLGHDGPRLKRLADDPRPIIRRPSPPAQCPVDHLEAAHLAQRLKSRVKSRHKTILQRIVKVRLQAAGRKVGPGQRLPSKPGNRR